MSALLEAVLLSCENGSVTQKLQERNIFQEGEQMKLRSILLILAVFIVAGAAASFASEGQMGTWKLNEAKSKLNPNGSKNLTVVYAADGDNIKITVDGVDSNGKPTHNEWTGKFDGKDYPVTGAPDADTRSYTIVDEDTLSMTVKKGGKVTTEGTIVLYPDGKSRVVNTTVTDSKGNKVAVSSIYDKQ